MTIASHAALRDSTTGSLRLKQASSNYKHSRDTIQTRVWSIIACRQISFCISLYYALLYGSLSFQPCLQLMILVVKQKDDTRMMKKTRICQWVRPWIKKHKHGSCTKHVFLYVDVMADKCFLDFVLPRLLHIYIIYLHFTLFSFIALSIIHTLVSF